MMNWQPKTMCIVTAILLTGMGCSAVQVTRHSVGSEPPLCTTSAQRESVVVYWGTAWRDDQKEPEKRARIANAAIQQFFQRHPCYDVATVATSIEGKPVLTLSDSDVMINAQISAADTAIVIRLEELGPNVTLYLSPVLWSTHNEVMLSVRSFDVAERRLTAALSSRWTRGGPFTAHSAESLPQDLEGLLSAVFGRAG